MASSTTLALVEDLRPEVEPAPLAEQQQAIQLMLDLEAAGMATPTALVITDPNLPYEKAEALAAYIGSITRRGAWYAGDLLLYSEAVYPREWPQIASVMGLTEQTLMHRMFVCKNVPPERRVTGLSFSCHALVARRVPAEQAYWLNEAQRRGWGYVHMRDAMRAVRKDEQPPLLPPDDPAMVPLESGVSISLLLEAAQAVIRDAVPAEPGFMYVPVESFERLRAAFSGAL